MSHTKPELGRCGILSSLKNILTWMSLLGLVKVLTSSLLQSNVLLSYCPECSIWDWEPCGIITAQTTIYRFRKPN